MFFSSKREKSLYQTIDNLIFCTYYKSLASSALNIEVQLHFSVLIFLNRVLNPKMSTQILFFIFDDVTHTEQERKEFVPDLVSVCVVCLCGFSSGSFKN